MNVHLSKSIRVNIYWNCTEMLILQSIPCLQSVIQLIGLFQDYTSI